MSPADNALNVGTTPTLVGGSVGIKPTTSFEWRYTVCPVRATIIGAGNCGTDVPAAATSGWVAGSWKVPAGLLKANTTYKWSVSARNNPYMGTLFDEEFWFSTGSTLAAPTTGDYEVRIGSPATQSAVSTLRPTLTMSLAHAASQTYEQKFDVSLCSDATCSSKTAVASSGWIPGRSWTVPSGARVWGATYSWTASARNNPYLGTLFPPSSTFATVVPLPAGRTVGLEAQGSRVAGVSLHDRHFEHTATDASLPSVGQPLAVTRGYSSSNTRVGAFGTGWSSVLDMTVPSLATPRSAAGTTVGAIGTIGAVGAISVPRIGPVSVGRIDTIGRIDIPTIQPVRVDVGRIDIPRIDISIPRIEIPTLDIRIDIPRFGIDRPAWAYPDPFVADNVMPVGQAVTGLTTLCGASTSAACAASIGSLGASCAVPGGAVADACAPAVVDHLWASVPHPGDAASTAAATGAGAATGRCQPHEVETDAGCESLTDLLQRKVEEIADGLRSDRGARDRLLSRAEREAEGRKPWLERANNGKAVERATARDSWVRRHFDHKGGAGQPDLVSKATGKGYEITTTNPSTIAAHLRRAYVSAERMVNYVMWTFGG